MITQYIQAQFKKVRYKILEDGTYFGEIPGLKGVWASAKNLEDCRRGLQEVLEEWILLKLADGDSIPGLYPVSAKKNGTAFNFCVMEMVNRQNRCCCAIPSFSRKRRF